MTPVLEFADVSRSYGGGPPALAGVTFRMGEAEVVGLVGRNGAGKTTLIRLAMGMLYPHGGRVSAFGLSPTLNAVTVKKRVGYVAEDQMLPRGATIAELIAFHRYLFPSWDAALESQLLDRFGLGAGAKIKNLSKGQARQAALLCAVCHRPELLILDEPAGGLDPAARREFLETSIQLLNREGTAILFSSHHMSDVERIGGRVIMLDRGRVRLDESLDSLREDVCVAMVPRSLVPDAGSLEGVPGCLRVRPVFDDWHAVIRGTPDVVRRGIEERFGGDHIRCVRVPLEEFFIEMVGGERE